MSRRRPNFSTRTPEEDVARLDPNESENAAPAERAGLLHWPPTLWSRHQGVTSTEPTEHHRHSVPANPFHGIFEWYNKKTGHGEGHEDSEEARVPPSAGPFRDNSADRKDKLGHRPRSFEETKKLGTFSGVFVPTSLNVLSILMFLRFGFILGQAGLLGILGLLALSYLINLVTTMSLSAIATNGTVRGGGAYYLISRSLGPEFGGSIGVVFYLGLVFNTGMNAVGLVDCFTQNFGTMSGTMGHFLREGFWWQYLWGTVILVLCTAICLAGSSIFARASNGLLILLLISTFSIPLSAILMKPFSSPVDNVQFTGLSWHTLKGNLTPHLTKGAAGSQMKGRETFQDLFGILFPATGGIFAGASMSGDLKNPSKSIPKGTLAGLALTFISYLLVILAMAASVTRQSFYNNVNVIQIVNYSDTIILVGEFATCFFSALMGVIGSAKLLQAIARDSLLPGVNIFGQGSKKNDEPIYAIIVTYIFAQLTMLFDINQIASFVTMTYLMTFLVTNLACFLLKIGSAPNFRPSFHYFNWQTAAAGTLVSGVSMFFVDGLYAAGCVGILLMLFLLIHYSSPPKAWGDVSQSLIYHQVRKYLLRLKQEHVKFWRPQILLFVSDLDRQYKMVSFCNSLKKGALFVLGHVLVTDDFSTAVPEARRQQTVWTKLVEYSKIKAFVNVAVSPAAEWGVRNIVLNSGLGGMRPNIVVIDQYRENQSLVETISLSNNRRESAKSRRRSSVFGSQHEEDSPNKGMTCQSYVTILEDLLFNLRINVAVAKGFEDLELPDPHGRHTKKYIDLWPIQMSAEIGADSESKQNVLTTNFDTYTLILQLGCILNTVPSWKKTYQLRVAVFVEYETDVDDERGRVEALLEKLRIQAEVLVFWLACGDVKTYRFIVNGDTSPEMAVAQDTVHSVLKDEDWWQGLVRARNDPQSSTEQGQGGEDMPRLDRNSTWQGPASQESGNKLLDQRVTGLRRLIQQRRRSVSSFRTLGNVNFGMQTHRLLDAFVDYDGNIFSSDSSDDSDLEPYISDPEIDEADDEREDHEEEDSASSSKGNEPSPSLARVGLGGRTQSDESGISPTRLPARSSTSAGPTPTIREPTPSISTSGDNASPKSKSPALRPPLSRSASSNRFSSSPIPEAKVNTDEGAGPSIMFAANASPPRFSPKLESIYARRQSAVSPTSAGAHAQPSASGYPGSASVPLSFNDLPSRAQHLILNELMVQHSSETAVIFTTLPSPVHGTSQSEQDCSSYLSDLEVLWQGLPPCLLVHSNSMTVTMNL
ncbi:putative cation chloride cotransporter [Penicillium brasilianum]|uniref:Putative cation chloride cotransporter n=1 Tax=Penicillium brasilianum TaxID=104259 RepID=A0A1S9RSM6_PENBI|nr:putative cation chloride cotransporter [Penicillium brasilianum]